MLIKYLHHLEHVHMQFIPLHRVDFVWDIAQHVYQFPETTTTVHHFFVEQRVVYKYISSKQKSRTDKFEKL